MSDEYQYHDIRLILNVGGTYIFNNYIQGWTVEEYSNELPQPRYNFVEVPGRDGAVNLTRATTGSAPVGQRRLRVRIARKFASFTAAKAAVDAIVAGAHGKVATVTAPDGVAYADMEVAVTEVEYGAAMNALARLTIECIGD